MNFVFDSKWGCKICPHPEKSAPTRTHPTKVALVVLVLTSLQEHECKFTEYLIDVDSNGDEDHENAECALQPHAFEPIEIRIPY